MEKIETLTLKHVFHLKIKAFTFVEILFALSVTLLCLSLTPNIINLTSYYLHLAKNNDDLDFEFFCRDILKDVQTSKYSPSKDNDSTIKIRKKDEEIRYIYNNKKIYKNINQRGNITLLNNVVFFKIIKTNNNILKIKIKQGDTNYYKEKNPYL